MKKIIFLFIILIFNNFTFSQNIKLNFKNGVITTQPYNNIIILNNKLTHLQFYKLLINEKVNINLFKKNKIKFKSIKKFTWIDSKNKKIQSILKYSTIIKLINDSTIIINYNIIKIYLPLNKYLSFFNRENTLIFEIENIINFDYYCKLHYIKQF